jgi:hypothetical protein
VSSNEKYLIIKTDVCLISIGVQEVRKRSRL